MRSCKPICLTTVTLALTLLAVPGASQATAIEINSGPNIKTELLRAGNPAIAVSFAFTLPDTAAGDGLFEIFAGGDLNNLVDVVSVTAGVQSLGALRFPINSANPALCDTNPAPVGCPVPEAVPGGSVADGRPTVGDVEGRRDVTATNFGTAGLIVPESLLVGGSTLTFSLTADAGVYDLYIDRLDLSYPSTTTTVPEPGSLALLALSLLALSYFRIEREPAASRRNECVTRSRGLPDYLPAPRQLGPSLARGLERATLKYVGPGTGPCPDSPLRAAHTIDPLLRIRAGLASRNETPSVPW